MAGWNLARASLLLFSLVAPFVYCDDAANEPPFPKLLDRTNPNRNSIHIISERLYQDGGYMSAEEFVDLDLGKAAYIETRNNVRTTWLVNTKENSIHKYKPFNCSRYDHTDLIMDSPNLDAMGSTKISIGENEEMFLYGISSLMEFFSLSTTKQYSKTANSIRTVSDLDGSERVGHKWSLSHGHMMLQVIFSELANRTTAEPGQIPELLLDSIEIKADSETTTINILSIEHQLSNEAYNMELQLPLIYGCRRNPASLSAEMQHKYDIIAADSYRHYLRAEARAINFRVNNPTLTKLNIIDLALSQPRDAHRNLSPVRALMIRQKNSQRDIKTVVDHYLNVKYEVDMMRGTCTISKVGTMDPPQQTNPVVTQFSGEFHPNMSAKVLEGMIYKVSKESYMKLERRFSTHEEESYPIVLRFSDKLTLNMSTKVLESILYTISKESFMKLEHRGDYSYAYFSDRIEGLFEPNIVANVVRKFYVDSEGRTIFINFAIWILEPTGTTVREVYNFNIFESGSLASDRDSAQAFDMSRECYLSNERALYGRDYAYFELDYALPAKQREYLRDNYDDIVNTFYRLIRTNMELSYLRVPELDIIFNGERDGFTIKMLVLDLLPLHLIYDELKFLSLKASDADVSEVVANITMCSELCWTNRCNLMTFFRKDNKCSVMRSTSDLGSFLETNEHSVTYAMRSEELAKLPREESRLRRQIEALHEGEIVGFDEFKQLRRAKNLKAFGNLRAMFKLNGQLINLLPVSARVISKPVTVDTDSMRLMYSGLPARKAKVYWDAKEPGDSGSIWPSIPDSKEPVDEDSSIRSSSQTKFHLKQSYWPYVWIKRN